MIKKKQRRSLEVEMGAFADIAFLLIIFFILTTTLTQPIGREITLPSTEEPKDKKQEEDQPTITLLENKIEYGTSEAEMEEVMMPDLRHTLLGLGLADKPDNERMVVVNVGEDVPYQRYYEVVTAISVAGGVVALMEDAE